MSRQRFPRGGRTLVMFSAPSGPRHSQMSATAGGGRSESIDRARTPRPSQACQLLPRARTFLTL